MPTITTKQGKIQVNDKTFKVLGAIKGGKRTAIEYFRSRDDLAKKGVEVDIADQLIKPLYEKEFKRNMQISTEQGINMAEMIGGFTPASPVIMGVEETLRGINRGKSVSESIKTGIKAGGTDLGLMLLGGKVTKGLGWLGKIIGKGKIPMAAVEHAIAKPQILDNPKNLYGVGEDIVKAADELDQSAKNIYASGIEFIKGNKALPTKGIRRAITKYEFTPSTLASALKSAKGTQMLQVSDDAIDIFTGVKKGKLTVAQGKEINKLLDATINYGSNRTIDPGVIKRLEAVSASLKGAMGTASPDIKRLNTIYHQDTLIAKNVKKAVTKGYQDIGKETVEDIKVGNIEAMAKQLMGKGQKKIAELKWLEILRKKTGFDALGNIKDVAAKEAIEKGGKVGMLGGGLGGFGAGGLGYAAGGGPGAMVAGLGALGASQMIGNPTLMKALIKNQGIIKNIPKVLRGATTPARVFLEQQVFGRQ